MPYEQFTKEEIKMLMNKSNLYNKMQIKYKMPDFKHFIEHSKNSDIIA